MSRRGLYGSISARATGPLATHGAQATHGSQTTACWSVAQSRWSTGQVALVALVTALSLTACSALSFGDEAAEPRLTTSQEATAVRQPPPGAKGLDRFYAQRLTWTACGPAQCSTLTVPVDYADPSGATISVALLKVPAGNAKPIGSLVVNPGGPGASGVDYAAQAAKIVSPSVRRSYDVVGFDPRGVGRSAPIRCLDERQLDAFLGSDPTPDDAAEQAELVQRARDFGQRCQAMSGALLAHVSTAEAAKDMDVLRSALGQTRLDYLGKSYGTFLGSTYADLFPSRVGRFVLDGVIAPDLSVSQINQGQAEGFETATRAYVADCVKSGRCPLGRSVDAGMQRLRDFLLTLDRAPIRADDAHVNGLTEGWGSLGLAAAMYDQRDWGTLTDALRKALAGDGGRLMALADAYARRNRDGSYNGNIMQVIYAVNCLDRADNSDPAHYQAEADRIVRTAPTWGRFLAWGSLPCGVWPVKATSAPKRITAAGSGPILVVGTTRDPATPYAWAQRLADQLEDGHLVTYVGDGHTAYRRSNSCVDKAVDSYLLRGALPAAGLRC